MLSSIEFFWLNELMKINPFLPALNKYKDLKLQQNQQQRIIFIYLVIGKPVKPL